MVDIREQYLYYYLKNLLLIVEELGITHSRNPKTNEHIVMTTDFVVTFQDNGIRKDYARTVKSKSILMEERVT